MDYYSFLDQVIEEGIAGAKADYCKPEFKDLRLDGSLRGFEDCRGKDVNGLVLVLQDATKMSLEKHMQEAEDYWYWECRRAEIGWVCNVVSALMLATGQKPITSPTARGYIRMAEIMNRDGCLPVREEL